MNHSLLWAITLLLSCYSYVPNIPTKQKASSNTAAVAIQNNLLNIFYIGIENPITVALPNVPIEQTKVSLSNGKLVQLNQKGKYQVTVYQEGKTQLQLEGRTASGQKVMVIHTFKVKRLPPPSISIAGKLYGRLPLIDLLFSTGLDCYSSNNPIEINWQVENFDIMVSNPRECDPPMPTNIGASWNRIPRILIENARIGAVIYIDNIHIKTSNGHIEKLDKTISFKIL